MLTRSELNIIGEIRDEIANMLTRQRVILQDKKATVFAKLAASVTLQALVSIEATILSLSTFTQGSYEALIQVEIIKRITTTTEWEAFNTQYDVPEVIFPKREVIMGMDWGDKASTVFAEAIKRADDEIEMGILKTLKIGSGVKCPMCEARVLIRGQDGMLERHREIWQGKTLSGICKASKAIIDTEGRVISYDREIFNAPTQTTRVCPICDRPIITGKEACAMGLCPNLTSSQAHEKNNPGSEEDEQGQQEQQSHENKS